MAVTTIEPGGGLWEIESTWDNGVPGVGDTPTGDGSSGPVTVNVEAGSDAFAALDLAAYTDTITMNAGTINVDGAATIGAGATLALTNGSQLQVQDDFTTASGATITTDATSSVLLNPTVDAKTLTTNGVNLGNVLVNGSSSIDQADLLNATSIDVQAGALAGATAGATVSGDCKRTGGEWTGSGTVTLNGTGDTQDIANNASASAWTSLVTTVTAVVDAVDNMYVRKYTPGGTLGSGDSKTLIVPNTSTPWWGAGSGVTNINVELQVTGGGGAVGPGNPVVLNNKRLFMFAGSSNRTQPLTEGVNTGTGAGSQVLIFSTTNGVVITGDRDGGNLTTREIVLGSGTANRPGGFLAGSGVITVGAGGIHDGAAASANEFGFETASFVVAAGITIDGDNFTVGNTSATVRGGGTVTNVNNAGNELDARSCVDGTGNTNVLFGDLPVGGISRPIALGIGVFGGVNNELQLIGHPGISKATP